MTVYGETLRQPDSPKVAGAEGQKRLECLENALQGADSTELMILRFLIMVCRMFLLCDAMPESLKRQHAPPPDFPSYEVIILLFLPFSKPLFIDRLFPKLVDNKT